MSGYVSPGRMWTMFFKASMTIAEIARATKCSEDVVERLLRFHGNRMEQHRARKARKAR